MDSELRELLAQAETLAKSTPDIQLVVLAKTASGAVCHSLITDLSDSAQLLALAGELEARGDTRVRFLLNLFADGLWPDGPSWLLRSRLLELDSGNREALVPVVCNWDGQPAYTLKQLSSFC